MKIKLLFISILISLNCSASVWNSENSWNLDYQQKYSKWIKSQLNLDIFTSTDSDYYGVATDCADFIYAMQIIFAYENKLPFSINYSNKVISNNINLFDNIISQNKRLKQFISHVSDLVGSYNLTYKDSVPVSIDDIRPGDFFTYKTNDTGETIFHSYLIKEINENGNLELIYSTTPKKVRKLLVRLGMPARPVTGRPFGFKRYKRHIPELDYGSSTQYDLVESLGPNQAMKQIKKLIQKRPETRPEAVHRKIFNMCNSMESRELAVVDALAYKKFINGRKMNKIEYYNYSTPSRDKILYGTIHELSLFWKKMKRHDLELEIKSETVREALNYLVGSYPSSKGSARLKRICSGIKINYIAPIDYKLFSKRYKSGKISSNPNSSYKHRWGEL